MSFLDTLVTSRAGMNAQASSTSMISNNIANLNTLGYKRKDASFSNIVSQNSHLLPFKSETVTARAILRADEQGATQQTGSTTNASIAGDGFFVVRSQDDSSLPFHFTRNGAFTPDASGILRNTSGAALYGWRLDQDGLNVSSDDFSGLEAVNASVLATNFLITTRADVSFNLDARQAEINPLSLGAGESIADQPAHFVRSQNIVSQETTLDVDGNPVVGTRERTLTYEFRKVLGPMAFFSTNFSVPAEESEAVVGSNSTLGIQAGDQFSIAVGSGATETYTFVDPANSQNDPDANQIATFGGLIAAIRNHGTGDELDAFIDELGNIVVQAADPTTSLTVNTVGATNALNGAGTLNLAQDPDTALNTYDPYATLDGTDPTYDQQADFPALFDTATPNTRGWWEMRIIIDDPADPNSGNPVEIKKGLINFASDGRLNIEYDAFGDPVTDPLIDFTTTPINFDDADTADDLSMNIGIAGLRQFSSNYNVFETSQNGATVGLLDEVELTSDGFVVANFTNGQSVRIYEVPLANFTNANGLNELSGSLFSESLTSGTASLSSVGTSGTGILIASTVEGSNVELSNEFAKLIISQRSYSANSRVISTVDEMTEQLGRLKR